LTTTHCDSLPSSLSLYPYFFSSMSQRPPTSTLFPYTTLFRSVFVAPFDDEAVVAGQGTIGLEIFQDVPEIDRVFVPIGGGGLAAGVAILLKQLNPKIQVIGVEPEESACFVAAKKAGGPVDLAYTSLFAEGV